VGSRATAPARASSRPPFSCPPVVHPPLPADRFPPSAPRRPPARGADRSTLPPRRTPTPHAHGAPRTAPRNSRVLPATRQTGGMADPQDPRVAVYLDFDNIVMSWYDRVHGRQAYSRD